MDAAELVLSFLVGITAILAALSYWSKRSDQSRKVALATAGWILIGIAVLYLAGAVFVFWQSSAVYYMKRRGPGVEYALLDGNLFAFVLAAMMGFIPPALLILLGRVILRSSRSSGHSSR